MFQSCKKTELETRADAAAFTKKARAKRLGVASATVAAFYWPTDLAYIYSDAGWSGRRNIIQGWEGTCDAAGYRINTDYWWSRNMSSIEGVGNCNYAQFWGANKSSYMSNYLPIHYLRELNDNVDHYQLQYM